MMIYVDILLRWMHILGAIALMGGSIFLYVALLPAFATLGSDERRKLEQAVRQRWSKVVMAAIGCLLISGIANMGLTASRYSFNGSISSALYQSLLGVKFLLALPIFFIASRLAGRSEAAERFRQNARYWVGVNLVLALTIVLLAGVLRFAERTPKVPKTAASHPAASRHVAPLWET